MKKAADCNQLVWVGITVKEPFREIIAKANQALDTKIFMKDRIFCIRG